MSRFHGRQQRGALREHRDKLYTQAIARQENNLHHGHYIRPIMAGSTVIGVHETPAPIELFQRKTDRPALANKKATMADGDQ